VKRALGKYSRDTPYDLVVNLECGAQCDDFVKFVHTREFHGRPLIQPRHIPGRHCVDTDKSIYAGVLGVEAMAAAEPLLKLQPDPEHQSISVDGDYVILNPGFSGIQRQDYRSHRSWPNRHWGTLIGLITQHSGLAVAINGTEEERQYFDSLLEMPGVHSLFGTSLPTLIRTLERARCVISVDTGTMHLATALGIPVIALFGPSDFELTGPYSSKVPCRVLTSGIDCQPCYQTPLQRQCTFNRCMQTLRPEEVYGAFEDIKLL
jgi:ADP-heptose:LPS heptosyltransferase